eukprot:CAMPEP_0172796418 /NCGR_PEP_ID=MMETSP1074-20121228/210976_1 /TAXON_ID=2916 /ORGANISM="Ceratium fusus, Strain PA161109" /LENGTH=46 /DNA_ID= /DNA_START= /DNA_END= /DNA_ORIENTATION=
MPNHLFESQVAIEQQGAKVAVHNFHGAPAEVPPRPCRPDDQQHGNT